MRVPLKWESRGPQKWVKSGGWQYGGGLEFVDCVAKSSWVLWPRVRGFCGRVSLAWMLVGVVQREIKMRRRVATVLHERRHRDSLNPGHYAALAYDS